MAAYRLADIVARLGGEVAGDGSVSVSQVGTLENARPDQIAFLANSKYRAKLASIQAGAVIVGPADADATALPRIVTAQPYVYFARVSTLINPPRRAVPGVHPDATVHPDARVDAGAEIGAQAVIEAGAVVGDGSIIGAGCRIGERVRIGQRALLYPNVVVYQDCVIGDDFIAHAGAVIGSDGFGIAMDEGRWLKIPQIGRVVIGNAVEVGANTTIDRGALDDTVIGDGVKLDNQIQVAHNVRIGAHTAIAGCVGIAGSAVIGSHCQIGGGAIILGHLEVADRVEIAAHSMVSHSIREAGAYAAVYPLSAQGEWRRNAVHLRHLDDMAKRLRQLEKEIETLKGNRT